MALIALALFSAVHPMKYLMHYSDDRVLIHITVKKASCIFFNTSARSMFSAVRYNLRCNKRSKFLQNSNLDVNNIATPSALFGNFYSRIYIALTKNVLHTHYLQRCFQRRNTNTDRKNTIETCKNLNYITWHSFFL